MSRPPRDVVMLKMALELGTLSTCARRAVGCILTDKHHEIVGSGYNGRPAGEVHCNERDAFACEGADASSGTNLTACEAVHAEINALMQCKDRWNIHTCYVSCSPCLSCIGPLLNTSCQRIVFAEKYPHTEAKKRWLGWLEGFPDYRLNPNNPCFPNDAYRLLIAVPWAEIWGQWEGKTWIYLPIKPDDTKDSAT
jgi:dCMP deaminase